MKIWTASNSKAVFLSLTAIIFLASTVSINLFKESFDQAETNVQEAANADKEATDSTAPSIIGEEEKSTPEKTGDGQCRITRNGVVEIVPDSSVEIDESSPDGIDLKVECDSASGSSSVKTNINVETNTN